MLSDNATASAVVVGRSDLRGRAADAATLLWWRRRYARNRGPARDVGRGKPTSGSHTLLLTRGAPCHSRRSGLRDHRLGRDFRLFATAEFLVQIGQARSVHRSTTHRGTSALDQPRAHRLQSAVPRSHRGKVGFQRCSCDRGNERLWRIRQFSSSLLYITRRNLLTSMWRRWSGSYRWPTSSIVVCW